jgi:hypothetical protein
VMEIDALAEEFVTSFPADPVPGVIYVSMPYATALHLCACGCRSRVVTPLARNGWELRYRGDGVTLHPSIGNWRMPCRSHYWVRNGEVTWIHNEVRTERADDHTPSTDSPRRTWWRRLWDRLTGSS